MSYNPFIKGKYSVGVRTVELEGKDNDYTAEIWYPAAGRFSETEEIDRFKFADELPEVFQEAVRDAEPADGKRKLVMYWHGGYGHRRELAAVCVMLASHGFAVAAADFPGDHVTHVYGADPLVKQKPIDESVKVRPAQAAEVIELIAASNNPLLSSIVDASEVGSFGMSMGGYTTLMVNGESSRMKASVAICPMSGTRGMIAAIKRMGSTLRTDNWKSDVSTFLLTGSEDCFVIVDDVRDLFERLTGAKQLAVLNGAGHIHWADNAEQIHETMRLRYLSGEHPDPELDGPALGTAMRPFSELCPADHATQVMRSIVLAHFEANLNGSGDAKAFLANDLTGTFAVRGIDVEVSERQVQAATS